MKARLRRPEFEALERLLAALRNLDAFQLDHGSDDEEPATDPREPNAEPPPPRPDAPRR